MPRTISTNLGNILPAFKRRETLDLYLADDSILRLSKGAVKRYFLQADGFIEGFDNGSTISALWEASTIQSVTQAGGLLNFAPVGLSFAFIETPVDTYLFEDRNVIFEFNQLAAGAGVISEFAVVGTGGSDCWISIYDGTFDLTFRRATGSDIVVSGAWDSRASKIKFSHSIADDKFYCHAFVEKDWVLIAEFTTGDFFSGSPLFSFYIGVYTDLVPATAPLILNTVVYNSVEVEYLNWIMSVSDFKNTIETSIDRLTVTCQNISSDLGFNIASDLRLLDYAFATYGRQFQSSRNESLIEDIPKIFPAILANAEADEKKIEFEIIADYDSMGSILGSRSNGYRCGWTYKNGVECTSTSSETDCLKTRAQCKDRGKEWEFGGTEPYEEPVATPPPGDGSGIGTGTGGGFGGSYYNPNDPCFTLETKVWTPQGDIPFADFPVGKLEKPIIGYSFDKKTGEIIEDEILEIFEHEVNEFLTFTFEHSLINTTFNHRFWVDFNKFKRAENFKLPKNGFFDTTKAFVETLGWNGWMDVRLLKVKQNSDKPTIVRNLHMKRNNTYFANRCAVSNMKDPFRQYPDYGYYGY